MANTVAYRLSNHNHDYQRNWMRQKRVEILALFGEVKCSKCGFTDPRALQVDHINGGGCRVRDKERSQYQLLKAVKAKPESYQLLCSNCNWIKREENNENRKREDTNIGNH